MKELVIHASKCVLVLDEKELLDNLPRDTLEKAIRKGKGYRRLQRVEQWEKSREDWRSEDINGR